MAERLLLVGTGGHAKAVLAVAQAMGRYALVGVVDDFRAKGDRALGSTVLGGIAQIAEIAAAEAVDAVFVGIGDNFARWEISSRIEQMMPSVPFATFVHPSAVVGWHSSVGTGTVVMPGAVIGAEARIGRGCVVNTASSIDHDGVMEEGSSLAPGAVTGGRVRIGRRSFVGLGASVVQGVTIGEDTVVGAGSLVLADIPDRCLAWGSPCRPVRARTPEERYL